MSIQIIADSACDLSSQFIKENNVELLPLIVHIDGEDYFDSVTIQSSEVYKVMREGKSPKTAQVTAQLFEEVFTKYAKQNKTCIYLSLSSELSGTYQTAVMVREQVKEEYPNFDLEVIDTKCVSLGLGLLIKHATERAMQGVSKTDILHMIEKMAPKMEHIFTVDNLDYLARGGRLSKASAFIGGLLNIKPLLHVEDGKLVPIEKLRGRKKVLKRMVEIMKERGDQLPSQTIGINHADDEESALALKDMIKEEFGIDSFVITSIGAVIGAHVGPGTLALYFLNDYNKS